MDKATPAEAASERKRTRRLVLSKSARRWLKIKADPVKHRHILRLRKRARAERLDDAYYLRRERTKWNRWQRERTRRQHRPCEQCGEAMPLRYVGPWHGRSPHRWRELSNRIFCDTCACEREMAHRRERARRQYVPRRQVAA